MTERRGVNWADAVGLGLVGLMILALVPTVFAQADARERELRNRRVCQANLRAIAQSMLVYAADHMDRFPRLLPPASATVYSVALKAEEGGASSDDVIKSLYKDPAYGANPVNALWLLVLRGDTSTKTFVCPSDPFRGELAMASTKAPKETGYAVPPADPGNYYRTFQRWKNVSYSVSYPWRERDGKVAEYHAWSGVVDASLPIMSDMAPYVGGEAPATRPAGSAREAAVDPRWALTAAASQNHGFEGQNLAFSDAHVEWVRTPTVGNNNDSIWGVRNAAQEVGWGKDELPLQPGKLPRPLQGSPGNFDTVMVPMRDGNGEWR